MSNDYYVAMRQIPGVRKFTLTARSASKNPHWTISDDGLTVTHTAHITKRRPRKTKDFKFSIVAHGLSEKEAKRIKDLNHCGMVACGYKKVSNGYNGGAK